MPSIPRWAFASPRPWQEVKDNDRVPRSRAHRQGAPRSVQAPTLGQLIPLISGTRKPENEWDERVLAEPGITARGLLRNFDPEKPVIAAINGHAIAGGMEMVQGTDIRISVPAAKFGVQEVKWADLSRRRLHRAPARATAVRQGHGTDVDGAISSRRMKR